MTRIEKALLDKENREINGDIQTMYCDGTWAYCCPFYISCGSDDLDEQTVKKDHTDKILGCRGITCSECWRKEE
ncbi:MAG: hypothetical protein ACM31M_09650 [Nitrososphaerota archaeon]